MYPSFLDIRCVFDIFCAYRVVFDIFFCFCLQSHFGLFLFIYGGILVVFK